MAQEEWTTDKIEVSISGFFTTEHQLLTPAGALGTMTIPAFSKGAWFRGSDGREIEARQTSWWKGEHELREGGVLLGAAWPQGFLQRRILVEYDGRSYALERTSAWSRGWLLADGQGTALLAVEPRGVFRRGAVITVLGEIPVELLVFAYYLVHKRWESEAAAASAAAGS